MLKAIFIGGKEIGYKCLTELLLKNVKPLLVIGNRDDDGKDNLFHNSLIKLAKKIKSKKIKNANTMYKYKKLPDDGKIDWKWSGEKIKNFIRAITFEPFDPPFFYLGKEKFIIINSKTIKFKSKMKSPL